MPSALTSSRSLVCHSRMRGERRDERSQRRGQRVVRGHHQEAHVIDDVLRRQQRAVLMGGLAEMREQVVAALAAADRNLLGEIRNDPFAAPDAARHLGARQRLADHGDRGGHHVDKGARDLVDLGSDTGAEERGRGKVERELFHRRVKQHRSGLRFPLRDPRRDTAVERCEIGLHRPRLEGDRQRASMQPVLLEIQQHQPARKQQAEDPAPAERRGELLGLVEQHQFIGLGPEQHEAGLTENMAAIDQPVFGGRSLHLSLRIGQHLAAFCRSPASPRRREYASACCASAA